MTQPAVLLLVGKPGTGKSTLAKAFAHRMRGRMTLLEPIAFGEPVPRPVVDWTSCDCVAIDDVCQWERASLARAVTNFEAQAQQFRKKLLLIVQDQRDLASMGVVLKSEPAILEIKGLSFTAVFSYQGQSLKFPA